MEIIPEGAAPTRLRGTPSWLITHTAAYAHRLVAAAFASAGAGRYHYALLSALEEFGPASQATLGRRTGIDRSDIVATINELAEREMVERTLDPADRRRNIITLTPAGVQQLRQLDGVVAKIQDELLAPLSADEREVLARLLARVLDYHARG